MDSLGIILAILFGLLCLGVYGLYMATMGAVVCATAALKNTEFKETKNAK